MQVAPGTLLASRYLAGEVVGRGGMGTVYRRRLRREARAATALSSPRVVRVIDLDVDAAAPFIVLEYVAGAPHGSPRRAG